MKKRIVTLALMMLFLVVLSGIVTAAADPVGGLSADPGTAHTAAAPYSKMPLTFDATFLLPTKITDRAGVLIGNYSVDGTPCISFEIYTDGQPRLYYVDDTGTAHNYVFNEADIRSDSAPVRLTITHDRTAETLTCYVNGEAKQTLSAAGLPEIITANPYVVGGDLRSGNGRYFLGILYDAAVYSDALTAEEAAGIIQEAVQKKNSAAPIRG